jgi:hypothetical protein
MRLLRFVFGFVMLAAFAVSALPISADTLWNRAVEIFEENEGLFARRMSFRYDEYDGRGELRNWEERTMRMSMGEDGETEGEILSATRNGEDVTEDRREDPSGGGPALFGGAGGQDASDGPEGEAGDAEDDGGFRNLEKSPFDPEEQNRVVYEATGEHRVIDGERARAYTFTHRPFGETATVGTAWLDVESGAPLLVEMTLDPLPRPALLKELSMLSEYEFDGQMWYVSDVEMVVSGQFLFLRRTIETTMEFSDYIRP